MGGKWKAIIGYMSGTTIALAIAAALLAWPIPTRAALTAPAPADPAPLAPTTATTFTVNTTLDAVNPGACASNTPNQCTLREAILEANATSGATIILPGLLAGEYYQVAIPPSGADDAASGDLNITTTMSIVGKPTLQHPSVVVDARFANDRVFGIGKAATVIIDGVTIRNGTANDGGGILNGGTLALVNTTVVSNSASNLGGGIFNDSGASLALTDTTVLSNTATNVGGGISNYAGAAVTLSGSTVDGNTATSGGGIGSGHSTLTLYGSTVSGNSASNAQGGGIMNYNNGALILSGSTVYSNTAPNGYGGGLSNFGTLLLTNSTLSGNTAAGQGGGIFSNGGGTLTNVTLSGNAANQGGGIYQIAQYVTQTLSLASTIIADSASGGNCAVEMSGYPLISSRYNLSSDETCAPYLGRPGDLNNANPNLGPLAKNGGPTLTHMPQFPSPAIDAIPQGINGCGMSITTDQRGMPRAADGTCDIGAVEFDGALLRLWLPLLAR